MKRLVLLKEEVETMWGSPDTPALIKTVPIITDTRADFWDSISPSLFDRS